MEHPYRVSGLVSSGRKLYRSLTILALRPEQHLECAQGLSHMIWTLKHCTTQRSEVSGTPLRDLLGGSFFLEVLVAWFRKMGYIDALFFYASIWWTLGGFELWFISLCLLVLILVSCTVGKKIRYLESKPGPSFHNDFQIEAASRRLCRRPSCIPARSRKKILMRPFAWCSESTRDVPIVLNRYDLLWSKWLQ